MNLESGARYGLAFLIGILTGGILGVLFAPHKGKVMRGMLDDKVHVATMRAERIMEEAREKADNLIKEAKTRI